MRYIRFTNWKSRFRPLIPDLIILAILLFAGWVYTYRLERFLDIGLYDESYYLHRGMTIPDSLPDPALAPLYSLWYFFLSFFQADTVGLYFLNYRLMTILPPMMMYMTLRINRVYRMVAFLCSIGFLLSAANFPVWPKVAHFAIIILLCGLSIACWAKDKKSQTAVLAVFALLTTYVRPEFFLSFILFVSVLLVLTALSLWKNRSIREAIPLAVVLSVSLLLVYVFGPPFGGGNRKMVAFGQHYARNWVVWHQDSRDPWTHWEEIIKEDFGDVSSPQEALLQNPGAVAHHVAKNADMLTRELKPMLRFLPSLAKKSHTNWKMAIAAVFLIGLTLANWRKLQAVYQQIEENGKHFVMFGLHIPIILLPTLFGVLLIAPRRHYMMILLAIVVATFVSLFFRNPSRTSLRSDSLAVAFAVVIALLTVRPIISLHEVRPQPILRTIETLRSLNISQPVNLLDAEGGYSIYLSDNYSTVHHYEKNRPFRSFLRGRSIDMIVDSERLRGESRYATDTQWQNFIEDPWKCGFAQKAIEDVPQRRILIKRELWEP